MAAELNIDKFEDFIAQYPIFEYRILNTGDLSVEERVRIVCQQECERYGSTWACPPAVGTLKECEERIRKFGQAVFFSSVAEVSDLMNMQEMLQTRAAHEELTTEVARFLKEQDLRRLHFQRNPVISVRTVHIHMANRADIRTECIPAWKAMAW